MPTVKLDETSFPFRLACLLFVTGALLCQGALAQQVEATRAFDDGTRLLESGDFRGAVESFARAEDLGLVSGALYYNSGVAHYRLDQMGRAVQYFERASRLMEDKTHVEHSLDIVGARLVDRFSELPLPIWKRLQRSILSVASVNALMVSGVALFLIFCGVVLSNILGYWYGAWFRRTRLLLGIGAVLFLAAAFSSSIWPAYPPEAVVLVRETSIREQPDGESDAIERIHEGLVVGVVSEGGEWVLVQLPNGVRGWLEAADVGVI